jgi:hypothetical protein
MGIRRCTVHLWDQFLVWFPPVHQLRVSAGIAEAFSASISDVFSAAALLISDMEILLG